MKSKGTEEENIFRIQIIYVARPMEDRGQEDISGKNWTSFCKRKIWNILHGEICGQRTLQ